ncbi:unnamed protein product [Clavelina lepadiformis]|uniref:Uncharacterized protein n=1 Tax=Clavelina lepadiformis TaxID=159417 RepID=A0ABP0F077_CLALP
MSSQERCMREKKPLHEDNIIEKYLRCGNKRDRWRMFSRTCHTKRKCTHTNRNASSHHTVRRSSDYYRHSPENETAIGLDSKVKTTRKRKKDATLNSAQEEKAINGPKKRDIFCMFSVLIYL